MRTESVKPEAVTPSSAAKPLPQATIKLQPAPAPAANRKNPQTKESSAPEKTDAPGTKATKVIKLADEQTDINAADGVPLPIALAAAVLALLAVAIQVWTFIS